jgi:hypothetical protein
MYVKQGIDSFQAGDKNSEPGDFLVECQLSGFELGFYRSQIFQNVPWYPNNVRSGKNRSDSQLGE